MIIESINTEYESFEDPLPEFIEDPTTNIVSEALSFQKEYLFYSVWNPFY